MILVDTNVIIDFWDKPTEEVKNNCEVWTNDKHFKLMQIVIPELKLFTL